MKIIRSDLKIVCDIKGCNQLAKYRLIMDLCDSDKICLCENCLKNFYREAQKSLKGEKSKNGSKEKQ